MTIAIGSTNASKIAAVELAFKAAFPTTSLTFLSHHTESGVSPQPMSTQETIKGAQNRAREVRDYTLADYGVGLEGGLQELDGLWYDCGWIVIRNANGIEGFGSTLRIVVPPKMMELIHTGKALGEVNDTFFSKKNINQQEGHFGTMTNNTLNRTNGYRDGVLAALTRFLHPELF